MRLALLFAAVVGAAFPLPVRGIDPGSAQGTMTSDGVAVGLHHALALFYGNEEGLLDGPEIRLLLSDRDVAPAALSGPILDRLEQLARKGDVRGLVLRLDPQQPVTAPIGGTVLLSPADPERSLTFLELEGGSGIEDWRLTDTRASGRLAFSIAGDTPADTVTVQAAFSAPRFRDEVTARLIGPEAADSAPAQALVRWNEALHRGDIETLKALSSDDKYAELLAFRAEVGDEALRKVVAAEPSGAELKRQIKEVLVRGDRAFIIMVDDDDARNFAATTRIGERWVID
ncbi:MAG: hypothetical protein MUE49_04000 [Rhodospirillales bacterium]|nr:hypothetical protein [Rhodospirillales bacterium]